MKLLTEDIKELADILDENYFTMGTTPADAVVDCLNDIVNDRIEYAMLGTDKNTILTALWFLSTRIQAAGRLHENIGPASTSW